MLVMGGKPTRQQAYALVTVFTNMLQNKHAAYTAEVTAITHCKPHANQQEARLHMMTRLVQCPLNIHARYRVTPQVWTCTQGVWHPSK